MSPRAVRCPVGPTVRCAAGLVAAGLVALLAGGERRAEAAVSWEPGSFEEVVARAKISGRWIVVDLFTTWCSPCHQMDEQVYPREEVGTALKAGFLAVRRDAEQGEGEALVKRYHVVGYPTVLVLDESGHEIDRLMGFVPPRELVSVLQRFREGKGTVAELERKLAQTPGDEVTRLDVATRHAYRGDPRAVAEVAEVVKGDPDNKGKRSSAKDYAGAIATLTELKRRFPQSEDAEQVPYNLGIAYHATGRDPEARAVLDGWIAEKPKDLSRYSGYAWLCFKNGFDRARGIEVAKRGLELDPKEDGLWDTLGELYAAVGKLADAREAESRALQLKPKDGYYTSQLRRWGGR